MKCPHCDERISIFSKSINNLSSDKRCPGCNGKIATDINILLFVVLIIAANYLTDEFIIPFISIEDIPRYLITGIVSGLVAGLLTRLKSKD
ncbi:hypothetical protein CMT41_07100 [Colwellia sp. MT41]|uniref:hypothetical protein n=1 Tax=Colwellia sp. MT41 TaxID=58049 RepID=UPI000717B0CB|nr:hypothetical protein [Colwellia sp. MT41]ALO34508.1 hypothetical protein CMT41_07100 [Colwellia sp. MT41]